MKHRYNTSAGNCWHWDSSRNISSLIIAVSFADVHDGSSTTSFLTILSDGRYNGSSKMLSCILVFTDWKAIWKQRKQTN